MEILRQHQGRIDAVFVAVGGGGLISGVAAYIKAVRPEIRVIGVQMNDSDAMIRSIDAGERVELADVGLFSDGTAVKRVGAETFRLARELVDEWWSSTPTPPAPPSRTSSRTRAASSSRRARSASPRSSSTCSAHGNPRPDLRRDHLRREHELRSPALRRRARRGRRGARGPVRGDDPRGARQLPALLRADRSARGDRVQLPHLGCEGRARLRRHRDDRPRRVGAARRASSSSHGFAAVDLTADELAKEHVRHMVGGRSAAGQATSGSTASSSPSARAR